MTQRLFSTSSRPRRFPRTFRRSSNSAPEFSELFLQELDGLMQERTSAFETQFMQLADSLLSGAEARLKVQLAELAQQLLAEAFAKQLGSSSGNSLFSFTNTIGSTPLSESTNLTRSTRQVAARLFDALFSGSR